MEIRHPLIWTSCAGFGFRRCSARPRHAPQRRASSVNSSEAPPISLRLCLRLYANLFDDTGDEDNTRWYRLASEPITAS
ncbi:hypothetical protein BRAO285_2960008 [Bradyrhizobium sp. ORS 285]|nr:hypothetical protein BRAO285_2960008 [Bradyrhizobium sp. ORS 285]